VTECVSPRRLDDALAELQRRPELRVIAGGTDLMVQLHHGAAPAAALLDLWRVDELRGIRLVGGVLEVGALTTYTELLGSADVRREVPILAEAAASVGAVQIQNRGTIGGNLANASPAADLAPVLSVLDAEVELRSLGAARRLSIHDFFVSYRKTALAPDELLTAVRVGVPATSERLCYRKVGTRRAQAISKVVMAAALRVEGGSVAALRVAAGSVAPTVVRLRETERLARGLVPSAMRSQRAALDEAVARDIRPIDDVRSTADYRRRVLANVLLRFIEEATHHG
jgi:xanthine dehydrogenase small subunit